MSSSSDFTAGQHEETAENCGSALDSGTQPEVVLCGQSGRYLTVYQVATEEALELCEVEV